MRVLVKVVGKDELVSMCHGGVDRSDLIQSYNVTTHQPVGYTLTEKVPPEAGGRPAHSKRFPTAVLPLNISHRQAYYELGVSALVSNLTNGRNGSGCVVIDGAPQTRRWMLEGSPGSPGVMFNALDQMVVDWQALSHDYSHLWTIRLGAVAINRDVVTDLMVDGPPTADVRDAWRTAMGGIVHATNPPSPPKSKAPVTFEECRKTKSVFPEGARLVEVATPGQARGMLTLLLQRIGSGEGLGGARDETHVIYTFSVECLECRDAGKDGSAKVSRLHFVSVGGDGPGGGGARPGFRSTAQQCATAIKERHSNVPFHRHRLMHFLRPYLTGAAPPPSVLACLTPFTPLAASARVGCGDSYADAAAFSALAAAMKTAAGVLEKASIKRAPLSILAKGKRDAADPADDTTEPLSSPAHADRQAAGAPAPRRTVHVVPAAQTPASPDRAGSSLRQRSPPGMAGGSPNRGHSHPHSARRAVTHHLVANAGEAPPRFGALLDAPGAQRETIDRNTTSNLNISGISSLSANTETTVRASAEELVHSTVLSDSPGAAPPAQSRRSVPASAVTVELSPATLPRSVAPPPSAQHSTVSGLANVYTYADVRNALTHGSHAPMEIQSLEETTPEQAPSLKLATVRSANLAEVVPAKPRGPEAKESQAGKDTAAQVKADFDMYRTVMDATLTRLRKDVVRVSQEKELVQKAVAKREKVWQRERGEMFTLAQELKLATRRVEELEAQRAELQGQFHEELTKLDRRQHLLVEEKVRTERAAAERIASLEAEISSLKQQNIELSQPGAHQPPRIDSQIPVLLEANTALHSDILELRSQLDEKNAQLLDALQARAVPEETLEEEEVTSTATPAHQDLREQHYPQPHGAGALQLPPALGAKQISSISDLMTGVHPGLSKARASSTSPGVPPKGSTPSPRPVNKPSVRQASMRQSSMRHTEPAQKATQLATPHASPRSHGASEKREARPGGLIPGALPGSFQIRGDVLRDRLAQITPEHPTPGAQPPHPHFASPEPRPETGPPAVPVKRSPP